MVKNHNLARAIQHQSWRQFIDMNHNTTKNIANYKPKQLGVPVVDIKINLLLALNSFLCNKVGGESTAFIHEDSKT